MRHEYYQYDKTQLLANPRIPLICLEDNAHVFREMAGQMAEEIKLHNEKGEKTVFICPVGPVGQYPYFVDMVNSQEISLKMSGLSIWMNIWMTIRNGYRWTTP